MYNGVMESDLVHLQLKLAIVLCHLHRIECVTAQSDMTVAWPVPLLACHRDLMGLLHGAGNEGGSGSLSSAG